MAAVRARGFLVVPMTLAACAGAGSVTRAPQTEAQAAPAVPAPAAVPTASERTLSVCADDIPPGLRAREILGDLRLDGAATSESARSRATELNRQGVRLANSGRVDDAMALHRQALRADPRSLDAVYELAYDHFVQGEPLVTADLLRSTVRGMGPLGYELLGNAYDAMGDEMCALLTYRQGLDRFPRSGQLWVELGLMAGRKHRTSDALELWEKGIVAEPTNASAYFRAGELLLGTSARLWGLLYLETAMNLEPSSERSARAGELLLRAYLDALAHGGSGLGEYGEAEAGKEGWNAFESLWRRAMKQALSRQSGPVSDAAALTAVRRSFLDTWAALPAPPPNPLCDRQRALVDAGLWDAYSFWLFRGASPGAWAAFTQANPAAGRDLMQWLGEHPLQLDDRTHMSRIRTMNEFLKVQPPALPSRQGVGGAALNGGPADPTWF